MAAFFGGLLERAFTDLDTVDLVPSVNGAAAGLDEVGFGDLGVAASVWEVAAPMFAGEGFAAGEKLICVCRLRSRAFLDPMIVAGKAGSATER
jgi:hypothetical protein